MRKTLKKGLAVLLAVSMIVSLLSMTAFAAETSTFADVPAEKWYAPYVAYVAEEGLMKGTNEELKLFEPEKTLTRAELVMVLYRMAEKPEVSAETENKFPDVAEGQWYTDAVVWAAGAGIVNGYGDGNFGPNDEVTREQMILIIRNYMLFKGYNVSAAADVSAYEDADEISDWAADALAWAVDVSLVQGTSETSKVMEPKKTSTRAEVATILYRMQEEIIPNAEADLGEEEDPPLANLPVTGGGGGGGGGTVITYHTQHSYGYWVDNGDGTHTGQCMNQLNYCNAPTLTEPHNHAWVINEDGTHSHVCVCGNTDQDHVAHTYVDGVCVCGAREPVIHEHDFTWTDNGDGTHTRICNGAGECDESPITESHTYENGVCTKCGAREKQPVTHTHNYTWVNNGNGAHTGTCTGEGECDASPITEEHTYNDDGVCTKCDAVKPDEPVEEEDLIAQAIADSVKIINDFEKPYLSITDSEGENLDVSIALAAESTGRSATVTANVKAETADGLTESVLAVASIYVYRVLGLGQLPADETAAINELKDIVKDVLTEMGITWTDKSVTALAKDIAKAILADGKEEARNIWHEFKDDSGFYFDSAKITCNGVELGTVNTSGNRLVAPTTGKRAAVKAIAKVLLESVKTESAGGAVKASALVKAELTGTREDVGGYADCTVKCAMNVESSLFTYSYSNGKHNVTVELPGVKEWAGQVMDDKMEAALADIDAVAIMQKLMAENAEAKEKLETALAGAINSIKNQPVPSITQDVTFLNSTYNVTVTLNNVTIGDLLSATPGQTFSGTASGDVNGAVTLKVDKIAPPNTDFFTLENLLKMQAETLRPVISVTADIINNGNKISMTKDIDVVSYAKDKIDVDALTQKILENDEIMELVDAKLEELLDAKKVDPVVRLALKKDVVKAYALKYIWDHDSVTEEDRQEVINALLDVCTVEQVLKLAEGTRFGSLAAKAESLMNRIQGHVTGVVLKNLTVKNLTDGVDLTLKYNSVTETVNLKLNLD